MTEWNMQTGSPYPLGATWNGTGTNFALFSANATKVELCLFDGRSKRETARIPLSEYTDQVWHGYLEEAQPGQLYGYRVHGPYEPENGHRFNPNKLLLDPYARMIVGDFKWHDALFGYKVGSHREDYSFDKRDSDAKPNRPFSKTIVYEAHVKGYTRLHPKIPPAQRGTFAGLAHPAAIDHLVKLGVTAIELLPIHRFVNDKFLMDKGLNNYWGYNTIGFFAPHHTYFAQAELREFRGMVRKLHEAGIEVILDVVYNHTAEGNHLGPTLSFKGIDNASYYRLSAEDARYYYDTTGCGNTFNAAHPRVLQLVMDSLRYWAGEMLVDGFRFDLAPALGRERPQYDRDSGFFRAVRQDPLLNQVKMIAEPWDIGENGYQVGGFPPGWSEWNGSYRDAIRSYWKGDEGQLPALASHLAGSADIYNHEGRRPWASVNFITAHDGFTLHDLVSYNAPHNEANQEQSGHDDNKSWNCGEEGETENQEVIDLRFRQMRNFLATLLFSQGAPMLQGGDEVARTQGGNNNAYCQDTEISWLNWEWNADQKALLDFTRRCIRLRREHPALRRAHFFSGQVKPGETVPHIEWFSPTGDLMQEEEWNNGIVKAVGVRFTDETGTDGPFLLLFNAHFEEVPFTLPAAIYGRKWKKLIDSALGGKAESADFAPEASCPAPARSLILLMSEEG
jgi:glycogen operon protein